MSFQRHTAKCLCTQPPGKLIFNQENLAVFQINDIHFNLTQQIYLKSLCRLTRLFVDPNKTIDDSKIDRFAYYVLCRKDPILSSTQVFSIFHQSSFESHSLDISVDHLSIHWLFFSTTF